MSEKGIPKLNASGQGVRTNRGRGGCDPPEDKNQTMEERKKAFSEYFSTLYNEFTLNKIDSDSKIMECVSFRIPIFQREYPEWTYEHIVAEAIGYCEEQIKDESTVSTPRVRSGRIVKTLKVKAGLKVGHMGLNPMLSELPPKNPNTLQTKMEEVITAEASWLTAEEEEKRSKYAQLMKKSDTEHIVLGDVVDTVISNSPKITNEEILEVLDWAFSDSTESHPSVFVTAEAIFDSINAGLNNIIKINVSLASELVQPYDKVVRDSEGNVVYRNNGRPKIKREYHFKPYSELQSSIIGVDKLPVIIEHQDSVYDENTVGCVRNLRADDLSRSIRGIAYLVESKLPIGLADALRKRLIIPVSIGFWARLGKSGSHLGEFYDFTQEGIVLHHLAICIDSMARCPAPLCGLNVDSTDGKIQDEIVFIKKGNDYLNITIKNDKKETNSNDYQKSNFEGRNMAGKTDAQDFAEASPKDIEAFISSLIGFLKGTVVEDRSQVISRVLNALKDAKLTEKKVNDSMDINKEDLVKLIQDSVSAAVQKKDEELQSVRDDLKFLIEGQKEAVKQVEDAKTSAKYVAQIKKFSKIADKFLDGKTLSELKLLADSVVNIPASSEKPNVIPTQGEQPEGETERKIKLADGTILSKNPDFSKIFDSVTEEFDLSGLSFIYPDQESD